MSIHQGIISIDDHKHIQLLMEDKVHQGRECRRGIAQLEWHH